ncbi:beta-glucosidase BglX [Planosporangium thailandense]|uniref:beta-glucosidase n=1 Tax=Planosporangium thailandense TaxID=765197 RepID=A0ABX0Y267_9ACTN|nr:beta-glucosidase BglX [Planosporangium thailandense]NJC72232.1 beta-glucosidase BglX [Planosporangium thailandense]
MADLTRRSVLKTLGATVVAGATAGAVVDPAGAAAGAVADPAVAGAAPRPDLTRPTSDPALDARLARLLRRMTVDEKLGQLQQSLGNSADAAAAARAGLLGGVLGLDAAAAINALQRVAVEESRLGIPLLFGFDVIHGFLTTFPIPLAQAASFDPEVAATDAAVAAREAGSAGLRWTFAPMIDVSHEPRWGRVAEGYGEDPYLASAFAVAKTRGYQGGDYSAPDRLAACAKHYVAYGGVEGGRDYNTVDVSEQRLRNLYLPPFRAAVRAGAATLMAAFNTINGVPAHGNRHTLTDVLRGEWGFDGFVVSDYTGVAELITHGAAADGADAARLALTAGVDMEMVSTEFVTHGKRLLAEGRLSMRRLDDAVLRILRVKARAGLFDRPYVDESREITAPAPADRAAARRIAARCMVLLKNTGALLPLSTGVGSIAVVGPLGDNAPDLAGTWAAKGARLFPPVTILEGIRATAPAARVTYAAGCAVTGTDESGIPAAVAAARAADVTVVAVGESADLTGEGGSRSDIGLPGVQATLVSAIAATGRPFVVVLVNGRPLTLAGVDAAAPAILEAWHPGVEGGNAVADVLFGAVNPGGRLPASFPRDVGQVPIYYNHENTGRPADPNNRDTSKYLDLPDGPLYPFGYGLSYTTFAISDLAVRPARIAVARLRAGAQVEVGVRVRNTGPRAGDEVVQLYLRHRAASVVQPVRRLRGFRRVTLDPGQQIAITFRLAADDVGFYGNSGTGELLVEPGVIDIFVGGSSTADLTQSLVLT